ncbi:hypothetical protein CAEBREN_13330 [Caenorhabditis brenneri]|uniref:Uncharacterized protein n=1 Tax=Caenorhabditis brenneri TaxID=135651 RepID=G0MU46_CAEBE|nr:hypothetical protein CAEBREN_13330 [Caenorhabditis brenneri]
MDALEKTMVNCTF